MVNLKEDVTTYMDQSDFITTLGWNAIKGLVSSALLVTAFIKLMDMLIKYGFVLTMSPFILFFGSFFLIYYYYFWSSNTKPEHSMRENNTTVKLKWKDFFYTEKFDSNSNFMALVTSWIASAAIYIGIFVIYSLFKYCIDNSGSDITMSLMRIGVIGLISTTFCIYTQRYSLNKNFIGTVVMCTIYGFGLSISTYLLGMIIGVSNMVFGVPITIAIISLQFTFTAVYTFMDLKKWSKETHFRILKEDTREEFIKNSKLAAKEGTALLCAICNNKPETCGTKPEINEPDVCSKFSEKWKYEEVEKIVNDKLQ